MKISGNNPRGYYDVESYQRSRETEGLERVPTMQAPSVPPAAGADDLVGQLANLELGHHQTSSSHLGNMSAALQGLNDRRITPRDTPVDDGPQIRRSSLIGNSTRMPARSNLQRDTKFHSMRHNRVDLWRADTPAPQGTSNMTRVPEE